MIILSGFVVLVGTVATLTLASFALDRVWPREALSKPLRCAAFLVLTFAVIYAQVVVSGAVGCFGWPLLGLVNALLLLGCLARDRAALKAMARQLVTTLSLPFEGTRGFGDRAFIAWLLIVAFVEASVPKSVGDDVDYHLQSIMQIVRSGATLSIADGHGLDLSAPTTYYLRGYEAIVAFFFQGPCAQLGVLLTALSALAIVYCCFLEFSQCARLARALTFFVSTSLMADASYKGDYWVGALSLFVMTVLIRHADQLGAAAVPVLAGLMLLLALKSSTLMVVALALVALVRALAGVWSWWRIAGGLALTLVLGCAFYLGNLAYLGNPLFPFRVAIRGRVLFEGPNSFAAFPTTVLGNLGRSMVVPFVRGLARVTSPLFVLVLPALLWSVWRALCAASSKSGRRTAYAFLAACCLTFVATPFSDNNGGAIHSQLYSGHTIRMALPLLLLLLALAASHASAGSQRFAERTSWLSSSLALVNVLWYDTAALLFKPANAFAGYAPLFHSDDVRVLSLGFAVLVAVAWLLARATTPLRSLSAVLLIATLVRPLSEVSSYAYSPAFRSLGQRSQIVAALDALGDPAKRVSVLLADGSTGALRGVITPILYRRFQRFDLDHALRDALGHDLVVVPALVSENVADLVHGRMYAVRKPEKSLRALAQAGYVRVFDDALYSVLVRDKH